MTNKVLQLQGTVLYFSHASAFAPTDDGFDYTTTSGGANATGAIDLNDDTGGLNAGSARQSIKKDMGALRARTYNVMAAIEMLTGIVTGERIEFYWMPSTETTQATGNVMANSGADAALGTGGTNSSATVAEMLQYCDFIGALVLSADDSITHAGLVNPAYRFPTRYGQLVVYNASTARLAATDDEYNIAFIPIEDEVQ